jgi:B12-binding domain/radical SAM domain protein
MNLKRKKSIYFRFFKPNLFSIAALLPLIPGAEVVDKPHNAIMIYSFATKQARNIYREVAHSKTDSIFIAGGPHPSARPEEVLSFFDYVVIGEGEETLPELIEALNGGMEVLSVKGLAFKEDGSVIYTGKRDVVDLDNYPPFDSRYIRSSIEISRGCPFNCSYCQTPQLFGHHMRHRRIDLIAKYAGTLGEVRFTSPNAFAYGSDGLHPRIEKIETLLSSLPRGRNIYFGTFPSEVRPEFINDRLLELVKEYCTNTTISMGGQSGSLNMLERIKRGHTPDEIVIGVEKCLQHGFTPLVDFIFGLPGETEEDQQETLKLIKWITGKGGKIHSHHFMPLPGTEFEDSASSPLSRRVDKIMGELALNGKTTGTWVRA